NEAAAPNSDLAFRALPRQLGGLPSLSTMRSDTVLVGAGAVGHGVIWALSRLRSRPKLTVIDPEDLDLGNLQRYVMALRRDVGRPKVDIGVRQLGAAVPYRGTFASFIANHGSRNNLVLAAV